MGMKPQLGAEAGPQAVYTVRAPITVIVLTLNEERNLPHCLESVAGWAEEIFVVDSGSTDRTSEIARAHGATVLEHPFETHAKQWNWALSHVPVGTAWILALDADHRLTAELRNEIAEVLPRAAHSVEGFYVKRRQIFFGRWIKHGGYYPKYLLKLLRRGKGRSDENELLDFRFYVNGRTVKLNHDLVEDNLNDTNLDFWISKHLRFATLQAEEEHSRRTDSLPWRERPALFGTPDQRVLWWKRIWYRMPLYLRPVGYFLYRYFFRLGFLDGRQGFVFHFLQGLWYRLLVDVKLAELQTGGAPQRSLVGRPGPQ